MDFSLERNRLVASGALGALGSSYGDTPSIGRPGVSDISRPGTPSSMTSLGHYPSRFMPPSLTVHSPAAGYALMGGYLSNGNHASEGIKSLMPDVQQYWSTAHSEAYPRYVINNNMYPPYPFLTGPDSMSLLQPGTAATTQQSPFSHRIYELHKDAFLGAVPQSAGQAGFYGLANAAPMTGGPPALHMPSTVMAVKQEAKVEAHLPERPSKKPDKKSHSKSDRKVVCKKESSKTSGEKDGARDSSRDGSREGDFSVAERSDTCSKHFCDKAKGTRKMEPVSVPDKPCKRTSAKLHVPVRESKPSVGSPNGTKEEICDTKSSKATHAAHNATVVTENVKTQSITTLTTVTVTSSGSTPANATSATTGSTQIVFSCGQPVISTMSQGEHVTSNTSLSPSSRTSPSLPFYHTLYAHPQGPANVPTGPRKVHATTYVPEIGTLNRPVDKSLPKVLESKVKSEPVRPSCCREKHVKLPAGVPTSATKYSENPSALAVKLSPKLSRRTSCDEDDLRLKEEDRTQNSGLPDGAAEGLSVEKTSDESSKSSNGAVPACGRRSDKQLEEVVSHNCGESAALDFRILSSKPHSCIVTNSGARKREDGAGVRVSGGETEMHLEVDSSTVIKPHLRVDSHVTSSSSTSSAGLGSPEIKPDSTTRLDSEEKSVDRTISPRDPRLPKTESPCADTVLNLSKSNTGDKSCTDKTVSRVQSKADVSEDSFKVSALKPQAKIQSASEERVKHSKHRVSPKAESGVEKQEDVTEHAAANNIPVGIAVARKRSGQTRTQPETHNLQPTLLHEQPTIDEEQTRSFTQDYKDREEFLRQQKAILSGSLKPVVTTALPPNLVVTGNIPGTDSTLSDDLRMRTLASQWLAASGHPSAWLSQNPYGLHPGIATTTTSAIEQGAFPVPTPSGFKIAQDSLTGQLFLVPTGADFVDQTGLWPAAFPGSHGAPTTHPHFQHILPAQPHLSHVTESTSPHSSVGDQRELTPGQSVCQTPETSDHRDESDRGSEGQTLSRTPTPTSWTQSGSAKDKSPALQSAPPTPCSLQDQEKPIMLPGTYIPDMSMATSQEYTYAFPGGHLPYVLNPGILSVPGVPLNLSEPLTVKTESPSVQSRGTSPIILTPPPSDETPRSAVSFREVAVFTDSPVTKCSASVQTCDLDDFPPFSTPVKLKEQCSQTCQSDDLMSSGDFQDTNNSSSTTLTAESEDSSPSECDVTKSDVDCDTAKSRNKKDDGSGKYNPFNDPQILLAADGLELLSTLAEKRSKCSDLECPSVFLSPSDSCKSDSTDVTEDSPELTQKECTPRRDVRRSGSPKWTFPKKDSSQQSATIGIFNMPSGLDHMDAMEIEMRMRLAELQRRYKEKQKELAKLQPKKDKERGDKSDTKSDKGDKSDRSDRSDKGDKSDRSEKSEKGDTEDESQSKRGPGRPRKRKFFPSKSEDETSSQKASCKESHHKKKRLAEELVDRMFRSLAPAKSDKLKSVSVMRSKTNSMNKKRPSFHSNKSATAKKTTTSDDKHNPVSMFTERKLFKPPSANIAKGNFKPFLSKKPSTFTKSVNKSQTSSDVGNLFANLENSLGEDVEEKRPKKLLKEGPMSAGSGYVSQINTTVSPSALESGLGLLAKFATSALTAANIKKKSKKVEEDSDTETSDNNINSTNTKRKPGRPKKCAQITTGGGTETIVAKKSKNLGLLCLSELERKQNQESEKREIKLDGQTQLKPIFLDEQWCRRRSERIFLSEPSPQPSPNTPWDKQRPPDFKLASPPMSPKVETQKDKDRAKVQKAKSLHELTQKVKKKYNKSFSRKSGLGEEKRNMSRGPVKSRKSIKARKISGSDSDGDDLPLIKLKHQEPRSCVIGTDELKDGLRVLMLQDGLFYEGAVRAIHPPDVYGVVINNSRGHRPYIFSQEEMLKDVIMDVKPESGRSLPEGTRICAYWSQQFSCLYPGTVAKTSPNPHSNKYSVNVEFDDGDSGRIPIDHIRLLPEDFPLVSYDPNPLLHLSKRRRRTTSGDSDFRKSSDSIFTMSDDGFKSKKRPHDGASSEFDDVIEEDTDDQDVFKSEGTKQIKSSKPNKNTGFILSPVPRSKHPVKENGESGMFNKTEKSQSSEQTNGAKTDRKSNPLLRPSVLKLNDLAHQTVESDNSDDEEDDDDDDDENDDDDDDETSSDDSSDGSNESGNNEEEEKGKADSEKQKPAVEAPKKRRMSSIEKYKNFVPAKKLWRWAGKSTKRPGMKGKARKEFFKSIARGKERISVGDCAVFLSTGRRNLPYVGRIDSMWESWGGAMTVKVKWMYHFEETKGSRKLLDPKGALFESSHEDENDVQTISHKCLVLSYTDFKQRRMDSAKKSASHDDCTDMYYLAGSYDPTVGIVNKYEADVI